MNDKAVQPWVAFGPRADLAILQHLVERVVSEGAQGVMIWAADGNGCQPAELDPWLEKLPVPVAGGVFPQLIHGGRNHGQGYLVIGWPSRFDVVHLDLPPVEGSDVTQALLRFVPEPSRWQSVCVWVDGLASGIASALDGIYDYFGSEVVYVGGGAGSLSFQPRPCLFSRDGMRRAATQLVLLPQRLRLGVDHGWQPLAGPFVVTGGRGNLIESLDHRPAYEVYREAVLRDGARDPEPTRFFDVAKGYPFGLDKPDGRVVVRDPIQVEGGALRCVGDVPPYSLVHLLRGEPAALIDAAARGAHALAATRGPVFVVDCISRVLYLERDFPLELAAIQSVAGERPVVGVLSLGEVANGGDVCLEFYNKTIVLAALADDGG